MLPSLEPQWLQAVIYAPTLDSTAHNNCAPDIAGRAEPRRSGHHKIRTTCASGNAHTYYSEDLSCGLLSAASAPTVPRWLLSLTGRSWLGGLSRVEGATSSHGTSTAHLEISNTACLSSPTAWESYGRGGISPAGKLSRGSRAENSPAKSGARRHAGCSGAWPSQHHVDVGHPALDPLIV